MANCTYELILDNGESVFFKSELELVSELLSKKQFVSKYGDIVYNQSTRRVATIDKLNKAHADGVAAQKYIEEYYKYKGNKVEYDEDGRVVGMKKPAMGVNKFLTTYTHNVNGIEKHIIPEFREKSYWDKKFEMWQKGVFDDQDKELIQEIEGSDFDFSDTSKITKDVMERWGKSIQEKWNAQGKTGTSLHAVSELFFSKDNKGNYVFKNIEASPGIIDSLYNKFARSKDKYNQITYGDYVSKEQFTKMIQMCAKLKDQIEEEYGEGCDYYPEFTVASKVTEQRDDCDTIVGIIDLLVIDSKGKVHIYDYKTSTKPYSKYNDTKRQTFTYQLAVYDRILQHYGVYTGDGTCKIVPIQLINFRLKGDKFVYDDIGFNVQNQIQQKVETRDLSLSIKLNQRLIANINQFLPPDVEFSPTSEKMLAKVADAEKKLIPKYNIQRNSTDQEIDDMIRKAGGYTPNKQGMLAFTFQTGAGTVIEQDASEPDAQAKLHKKVKEEIQSWAGKKRNMVETVATQMNQAIINGTPFIYDKSFGVEGDTMWLQNMMAPYCNGDYEVYTEENASSLGMIFLRNVHNGTVTVLKLTGAKLDRLISYGEGRTNMNGMYSKDIEQDSKGNSLMLKAYVGNIEAMEALLALQYMDFKQDLKITEVKVINPFMQKSMPVTNKELLYTYKDLLSHQQILEPGEENKFQTGKYQLLNETEKLFEQFNQIIANSEYSKYTQFQDDILPQIHEFIDQETGEQKLDWKNFEDRDKLLSNLNKLRLQLESSFYEQVHTVRTDLQSINTPEYKLYQMTLTAIAELRGVDSRQQIEDSENWIQSSISKLLSQGWEGLNFENPGNFKSPMLNQLTKTVSNIFQKVRDKVIKQNRTLRKLMEELKKEANYGWVSNNITGNATSLFDGMITTVPNGDVLFVNPNTLTGARKKLLEFALDQINRNRYPTASEEELKDMKNSYNVRYYRVPLMKASTASKRNAEGIVAATRERLKTWKPAEALRDTREKLEGFFFDEDKQGAKVKRDLYEMGTKFDAGESDRRLELIKREGGEQAFEHNIETILIHHTNAYALKKEVNQEMPIMKAIEMGLAMQGAGANVEAGNFNNIIAFIEKYIKYAIKNENIANSMLGKEGSTMLSKVRTATSILALGLSPRQFTYQSIEGIWKSIALIIKKPDGTNAFSLKNMWTSFKDVYRDLAYYQDKPSKNQQVNEIYGVNDMDSNQFADHINSDKSIWTHFHDFLFRFASRADYYNRMTIFQAHMREDGTWDAHVMDKDGNLIYDWKLDKRYASYAKGDKSAPDYLECKSRYLAALTQFQQEGVTNEDGSPLKIGDAIPRAYTNMEAQSIKAIGDNIYGYYNHETKSMMSATLLGAMAMQMKTYWSAKKNQYLAPGGCKLIGKWVDYKEPKKDENGVIITDENGNPIMQQLYYASGKTGEIDLSKGFVTEDDPNCSGVKVQQWQGQYQEGVISTLMRFGKIALGRNEEGFGGFKDAIQEMWYNPDDNLRTAYRSNIKHLAFDLVFMLGFGNIVTMIMAPQDDDLKKIHLKDKGSMDKAVAYNAYNFLYRTLKSSFMDFNFIDSIFSPVVDWQPMSLSAMSKLAKNLWDYFTTDRSFTATLANSSAVTREFKPILRCLTYDEK